MTGSISVRDILAGEAERTFVGRQEELTTLLSAVESAPVTFVHGIGGVGKSRLLEVFSAHARTRGAFVVPFDFRRNRTDAVRVSP
jgi:AAA+ ATPase superfamily predicted ATPase